MSDKANSLTLFAPPGHSSPPAPSGRFRPNAYDLLGQACSWPPGPALPGAFQPKLEIAWNSFHQNFLSGIPVFFQRVRIAKEAGSGVFRDCRVQGVVPRRAILAAALWHVVVFILPWPQVPLRPAHNSAFDNTELTWSGPIEDLPLLSVAKLSPRKQAKPKPSESPAAQEAEAFHPRQRIFTDPVHPTHPRQTLINPSAPPDAPKFLPDLPNVVQLAAAQAPARPRLEISERTLEKLRPRETKRVATTDAPSPELPNLEQRPAEISLATSVSGPARPKLQINAGSAPRASEHAQKGDLSAPEVAPSMVSSGGGAASTLIALSATPAPPAPVIAAPQGNLAARISVSPEGKPGASGSMANSSGGGASTAAGTGASGKGDIGISISGGNPKPVATASGLGGSLKLAVPRASVSRRPDANADNDLPERVGPPNFASLPPGAKPEQIFGSHHVYSMNVNMPNLNSATGSWIIHFSELHLSGSGQHGGGVTAPVPVRKVDPKYPQFLVSEHVEGEVILYGVIRRDGTVDSIQLVRGVDEQLDGNAVAAFAQWKFEPAGRDGQPVDLEAIVHIPFRAPERR